MNKHTSSVSLIDGHIEDAKVIKALECCEVGKDKCRKCPFHCTVPACSRYLAQSALDLIKRQQAQIQKLEKIERFATKTIEKQDAEIEKLEREIEDLESIQEISPEAKYLVDTKADKVISLLTELNKSQEEIKSEAIKEFAEDFEYFVLHEDPEINDLKCKDYESYMGGVNQFRLQIVKGIDNLVKEMTEGKKIENTESD